MNGGENVGENRQHDGAAGQLLQVPDGGATGERRTDAHGGKERLGFVAPLLVDAACLARYGHAGPAHVGLGQLDAELAGLLLE